MLIHNADITGSLLVNGTRFNTGSFSGSFTGAVAGTTATASYVEYNNVANKPALVSGSSQITYSGLTGIPSGIVSGSSQVTYSGLTGIPVGIVSGSSQVTYSGLTGIPSGIVSGSAQVAGFGIFATTGSNQFNGNQAITGSLTVTGQVVAQTLNVQQVTSSIVFSSGSNIFGNSLANTQQLTGSVSVTGSFAVTTTGIELQVTNAGVNLGNIVTDNHNVTGSLRVSGSMAVTGAGTFSSSVTATNAILSATGYLGFGGGTNYIEGDNNNNIVRIGTNNVPRVTINSSGNVGIGTASPGSILQANFSNATTYSSGVTGNGLTLYNTSTTNNQYVGLYFLGEPASGNAGQATIYGITTGTGAMDLAFSTRGSSVLAERMRITSGGNIEIGTTGFSSPSGADRFIGVYGAQDSSLILQDAVQLWELYVNDDFYINRGSTNVLTALRSNGNVGIGTTSPGANLHVVRAGDGGSGTPGVILSTANGANDIVRFQDGTTTVAVVKNDGSIGIGTPSPDNKLTVWGTNNSLTSSQGNINVYTTDPMAINTGGSIGLGGYYNTSNQFIPFANITGKKENSTNSNAAGYLAFLTRDNAIGTGERMRITSGGNVGIGTTSPNGKLTIKAELSDTTPSLVFRNEIGGPSSAISNYVSAAQTFTVFGTNTFVNSTGNLSRFDTSKESSAIVFDEGIVNFITGPTSTTASSRMRVTSQGYVIKSSQPAFRAGRNASYNPGANSNIIFNSVFFNTGGHYNATTGLFTAPIAGIYYFSASVIWESLADGQEMDDAFDIRVNGGLVAYDFRRGEYVAGITGNGGYYVTNANVLVNLAANDNVSIRNYRNLAVHGNPNFSWFVGYLLG